MSAWGRTKEEAALLAVAAGAAAVAVWMVRSQPPSTLAWTLTAAALGLALSAVFAFWFAGAVRRVLARDDDALRDVVSALPDGLLVVEDGRVLSVNRRLCDLLGYERDELVGAEEPLPFWPPEFRHEHERWHAGLGSPASEPASLVFLHRDGRRLPALVAAGEITRSGAAGRYVLTVRDVSASHRRVKRLAELSSRDAVTGLLNERGFEERLRDAVRRALAGQTNVAVALLELADDLGTPEGLIVVDRLRALVRAGEDLGRTRGAEVAWILPETGADGALEAVARVGRELGDDGVVVSSGVCDLATAGDALALYALAGQALARAKARGEGATVRHEADTPALLQLRAGSRAG